MQWIEQGKSLLGLREIAGGQHSPKLQAMLADMGKYSKESKAWWKDDETPWCGLFVGWCLGESGRFVIKNWFRASAWNDENAMTKLAKPCYGCIVTFTRQGGGHVGFVVGEDKQGNLMVLGGNQNNQVSIAPFARERVSGFYFPSKWENGQCVKSRPDESRFALPKLASNGKLSTHEA